MAKQKAGMIMKNDSYLYNDVHADVGLAAAMEAKRLSEKYGKDFLDCDDLVNILGVGKNNVRQLLNSNSFPTVEIGNRKVVGVIAFAMWSLTQDRYA